MLSPRCGLESFQLPRLLDAAIKLEILRAASLKGGPSRLEELASPVLSALGGAWSQDASAPDSAASGGDCLDQETGHGSLTSKRPGEAAEPRRAATRLR